MDITVILLNDRRPEGISALIESFRSQSKPIRIILGDNARERHPMQHKADRYVHVPWNAGMFLRLSLSFWVDTEWVMYMDDDRLPKDRDYVRDALATACEHRGTITGPHGRRFFFDPPHYRYDAWGPVEIVKGFNLLFERSILPRVPMSPPVVRDTDWLNRADDMHLSLMAGLARPCHWSDKRLYDRLRHPDKVDVGLTAHPKHNEIREIVAGDYAKIMRWFVPTGGVIA